MLLSFVLFLVGILTTNNRTRKIISSLFAAILSFIFLSLSVIYIGADYFTDEGFNNFKDIVEKTKPYTAKKRYNLNVIEVVTSGLFEVRGIKVHVDVGETEASPVQYLVFSFNKKGKIARVMLHAYILYLQHPRTGEFMQVIAPPFEDIEDIPGQLKFEFPIHTSETQRVEEILSRATKNSDGSYDVEGSVIGYNILRYVFGLKNAKRRAC